MTATLPGGSVSRSGPKVKVMSARHQVGADLRRERLVSDLEGAGFTAPGPELVQEVVHALELRPHEGVLATYGAIILTRGEVDLTGWGTRVDFEDLDRLRELADGTTSFVVRSADGWHLAVGERPARETDLVALCVERDARILRLRPGGQLQVLGGEHVWVLERATWKRHPTSAVFVRRLAARAPRAIERDHVCRGLLDLAVHTLSPRRIGATLVWLPDDGHVGIGGMLGHGGPVPPLPVAERSVHHAIANLLGQHDGATLLSLDGRLVCTGVELLGDPTPEIVRHLGMRHRSAARFSRLRPEAIVVVVSEDGPVSIYVDGDDVTGPEAGSAPTPQSTSQPIDPPTDEPTDEPAGGTATPSEGSAAH